MILKSTSYKWIVLILICTILNPLAWGQEQNKKPEKPTNAQIRKNLRKARRQSSNGKYEAAERKYLYLLKSDPNNYDYNAELGFNYFNSPYKKVLGIPYLEKALKKAEVDYKSEFYYPLGTCYRMAGRYDEAIESFTTFLNLIEKQGTFLKKKEEEELKLEIKREIESCNFAKAEQTSKAYHRFLIDSVQHQAVVKNLSRIINSPADDYSPVFTNNDSTLIYTSRKEGSTGGKISWDGKYYEDIYLSNKVDTGWSQPVSIGSSINTKKHDASNSVSTNKRQLYIYRGDKNGSIFVSTKLKENQWSKPKRLSSNINTKAWETSLGISLSDTVIYFSSDRKGGQGGRDLYKATRVSEKLWSTPVNLGPEINSPYEEDSPFISADGKTLYFASTGHNSIGGFDVFVSKFQDGKWSKPENLGRPVNSENHDIYFVTSSDGKKGYLSSSRINDTLNDMNIYIVDFECDSRPEVLVRGIVLKDGSPVLASSKITVIKSGEETAIGTTNTDSTNGSYTIKLAPGNSYTLTVETNEVIAKNDFSLPKQCDDYDLFQQIEIKPDGKGKAEVTLKTAAFDINKEAGIAKGTTDTKALSNYLNKINTDKRNYTVTSTTVYITKKPTEPIVVAEGELITFSNLMFAVNKFDLTDEAQPILNSVVEYLKSHPDQNIEIYGHASSDGQAQYNMNLSRKRANSVASYLAKSGILKKRIHAEGFGSTKPIASNDTEEGKKLNRRVELKIKKK